MPTPPRLLRRMLAGLAPACLALCLAGCDRVDPGEQSLCLSIVPVVERAGATLTVTAIGPADPTGGVAISYAVDRLTGRGNLAPPRQSRIVCRFSGSGIEGATTLTAVETPDGMFSEAQLYFLRRFWLSDGIATVDAMAALRFAAGVRKGGLMDVSPAWGYALQQAVNAIAPAALYAVVALAYSLVYGLISRINLAFGELATIGGYAALAGLAGAVAAGLSHPATAILAALACATTLGALWGAALGRIVVRPLVTSSPMAFLVATIGLSLAISEFIARVEGVRERWSPPILANTIVLAGGEFPVVITQMQAVIGLGGLAACLGVVGLMPRTRFGRRWRAAADDPGMAELLGIDTRRLLAGTMALAGLMAGAGGAVVTLHFGSVGPHMGALIGLKALVAAIIGGIGSLRGAALGGLAIGLLEAVWSAYWGIEWRDAAVLGVLALYLVLRPGEETLGPRALRGADRG